jgi:hypothetical protein
MYLDFEDRQQMRDRWLRDAFAGALPSPTADAEPNNHNELRAVTTMNSIDEEEAVRLLIDYGIAEDKAKVRLQVRDLYFTCVNPNGIIFFARKFKHRNLMMLVDFFLLKNLLMYLKNYQLDQKYIIYLSGN